MAVFEFVLLLLVAAVLLSALARAVKLPYPALLALAGAGLALLPVRAPFQLDPVLALALFVSPVLLDAAYDTSLRDLKANWLPVTSLVLGAVLLTIAVVSVVARAIIPDLPWSAAMVLGAIVAPPDAAAATAVLNQVRPPHRIMMILGGESLLNDASALLIYKLALNATLAGGLIPVRDVALVFSLSVVGSLVVGPLLARTYLWVPRLKDVPSSIILQFVGTFGVWILAERLGLSPILTVVAYAMTIARYAPAQSPARMRIPSYAVWETVVLILNTLAFVLVGLQLRPLLSAASGNEIRRWIGFAATVLVVVILVRILWVMSCNGLARLWQSRGRRQGSQGNQTTWQTGVTISWSGMRGIVTLATALALPAHFPHRDLLLFTAFLVVIGTLVVQGITLRPLLLWLSMPDDGAVEREMRAARVKLAEAALQVLATKEGLEVEELRREFQTQREFARQTEEGDGRAFLKGQELRRQTLKRRREILLRLREKDFLGDDAFHRLEEELDYSELSAERGM